MNRYNELSNSSANKSVQIVSVYDIRSAYLFDTLSFTLPGIPGILMAEANLIEDNPTTGTTWSAQLLNKTGSMSLTWNTGQVSGYIQADANFWELLPGEDSLQFLVERSNSNAPCGNIQTASAPVSGNIVIPPPGPEDCSFSSGVLPYNTCEAIIYVLIVVTPEAKNYILNQSGYTGIDAFINAGRNRVNQAFANSDIPNKQIVIKWIERDYSNCITGHDIISDGIDAAACLVPDREELRCDVAIVLSNEGYGSSGYTYFIGPNFDNAFSIIEASEFLSASHAFPHELGHLLGARHNWPNNFYGDDNAGTCAHAYCWPVAPPNILPDVVYEIPLYTTILGENKDGWSDFVYQITNPGGQTYLASFTDKIRLLNYSNPDVNIQGNPTGRTWADNSKLLRNTACEVADFFPNNHLAVFIRSSPCNTLPYTLTASIHTPDAGVPGIGPYTVKWYYNNALVGTGLTLSIAQHFDCPVYWVECRVTSADSLEIKRLQKVDLRNLWCTCTKSPTGGGKGDDERSLNISTAETFKLYPNPIAGGILKMLSPVLIDTTVQVCIYDAVGHMIQEKPITFDVTGQAEINIGDFASGLYCIKVKGSAEHNIVAKFLINQ